MTLLDRAAREARRFHHGESGAVILMCLAAFMILFMTAMVLYDAGQLARDKIDAQTGADVHAYSQAATKARAMNMVAFENISKRTLVGIHNTYWAMTEAYIEWWLGRCGSCSMFNIWACLECAYNSFFQDLEKLDWYHFTGWYWHLTEVGRPYVPLRTRTFYPFFGPTGTSWTGFQWQTYQIDQNSRYEVMTAPWWAWGEGITRAARNGSSITGSYPPLANPLTVGTDWVDLAVSTFGGTPSGGTGWIYDFLPVANWHKIFTATPRQFPVWVGVGAWSPPDGCSSIAFLNQVTAASFLEFQLNVQRHEEQSCCSFVFNGPDSSGPINRGRGKLMSGFCLRHFPPVLFGGLAIFGALLGVLYLPWFAQQPFAPLMWISMAPFLLSADGTSFQDISARSNIVFSYHHDPYVKNVLEQNYDFIDAWSEWTNPRTLMQESGGVWAMSASEVVFPESNLPRSVGIPGWGGAWMWHTGWTAKLRPVALRGEYASLGYGIENMFRDVSPFLGVARTIIGVFGPNWDGPTADADVAAMHKAALSMDNPDGLAK